MTDLVIRKSFSIKGGDLKRALAEDRTFRADRTDEHGVLRYMAHADGYVMARRPGCVPFVLSEKKWRAMATALIAAERDNERK